MINKYPISNYFALCKRFNVLLKQYFSYLLYIYLLQNFTRIIVFIQNVDKKGENSDHNYIDSPINVGLLL